MSKMTPTSLQSAAVLVAHPGKVYKERKYPPFGVVQLAIPSSPNYAEMLPNRFKTRPDDSCMLFSYEKQSLLYHGKIEHAAVD